jgi:precorrin-3B C17-methyltransferase
VYIDLIRAECPATPVYQNGMFGEADRCREALRLSREGLSVAVVCSGDAAVYGMASLILELADESDDVEVIPGVTAALAASAILGAPLSGDFAVVSLSDLLTPWEMIERRLDAAAMGDFCLALYNPSSRKRAGHLARAVDILLRRRSPDTPCGWARNIGRDGQSSKLLTLAELRGESLDMFTTVIIGNGATVIRHGRLVTPRGYHI